SLPALSRGYRSRSEVRRFSASGRVASLRLRRACPHARRIRHTLRVMDGTGDSSVNPDQAAPSQAESLSAHAEGSISEDAILASPRERAVDIGAGAVTPAVGALLSMLAKLSGGKAVAEVGTGVGVSGLWLLSGMSDEGVLTTIDIEPEYLRLAKQAFTEAG